MNREDLLQNLKEDATWIGLCQIDWICPLDVSLLRWTNDDYAGYILVGKLRDGPILIPFRDSRYDLGMEILLLDSIITDGPSIQVILDEYLKYLYAQTATIRDIIPLLKETAYVRT
jgi:hypothetical protein